MAAGADRWRLDRLLPHPPATQTKPSALSRTLQADVLGWGEVLRGTSRSWVYFRRSIGAPGVAARPGPHGHSRRSNRDVGSCGSDLSGGLAAESRAIDSWAYRQRLPFPDRARRGPAVNSAPL